MNAKRLLVPLMLAAALVMTLALPWALNAPARVAAQGDGGTDGAQADLRTVTVTGYGVALGAPDLVRIGLGVEGSSQEIMSVMDDVNTRMERVLSALQAAGIPREDIRTSNFSIYQDYGMGPMQSGPDGQQPDPFYRVSNTVNVTVRQTDMVGDVIEQAVNAGANVIQYIEFDIANRAELQADARESAVNDARDRAGQLASLLGMGVGDAISITENSDFYMPYGLGGGGGGVADAAASAPPISEGQLSVNMSVTITFALVAS